MNLNGKYYNYKKDGYDDALKKCIEDTCKYCIENTVASAEEKINKPIMMLGKIQSGKTRAFTGLISLAFDNDFDMIFILTKNSKALTEQTVKRMKQEFTPFIKNRSLIVSDILKLGSKISGFQLEHKNIIVAKKQQNNIAKIIEFIESYSINENKRCLIIDDEADTTGIGFEKKKGTDEFTLRTVSNKVNEMRGTLNGCVFVEVTATPYALYLQPDFDEDAPLHPIKPSKTILVPHGSEYIGGKYYFLDSKDNEHPASLIFEAMSQEEGCLVSDTKRKGKKAKIDDRRTFKLEEILYREDQLVKFKDGIVNFIIGSIVLSNINRDDEENQNQCYSYVIHTSTGKTSHLASENIVAELLNQIKNRDESNIPYIEKLLKKSYSSIKQSVVKYDLPMLDFDDIKEKFYYYIDSGRYSVDVVNADQDIDALLDDDTGELFLKTPCSIFIGGQILDRGVTIPNMIGFYYGRNPVTMQQDTVLQHSRMFGYRKDLLPVTRFYTTERIHSNMEKITEIDETLREDIAKGNLGEGVYFITNEKQDKRFGQGGIKPCSPSKVSVSDIILLKQYKRLLPVGFSPVVKSEYLALNRKIEKILGNDQTRFSMTLPKDKAIELIELVYKTIQDDDSGKFVSVEEFITTLKYMSDNSGEINFIVRKDRNMKKYKENGNLIDSPDDGNSDLPEARKLAQTTPCIMLFGQNGNDESWDFRSFWWPVLVAPKNVPQTMYASKVASERIVNKKM